MTESYWLGSSNWAATRLRLQYELTQTNFDRSLLDPSIPIEEGKPLLVADVGTGTGVWALDFAEKYPNAKVEGLDVDLKETPPTSWLPENATFREFDLLEELPEEFAGKYDIVHLQYVMVFVRDWNVDEVMERLKSMLKPGGYIQWTDSNRNAYTFPTANPNTEPIEIHRFLSLTSELFGKHDPKSQWLNEHQALFERHGLEDVKFVKGKLKASTRQPVFWNWIWALQEGMGYLRASGVVGAEALEEWEVQRGRAEREARELGVGMDFGMGRCVGRKSGR